MIVEESSWDDIEISICENKQDEEIHIKLDQSGDVINIQLQNLPDLINALYKLGKTK